ncbi:AEC family transporter [Slackia piriformis]|uniref:AEC family transporter n=1 Tax=Slackia piriformis TaxID=626934 RepID=UPI0039F56366
MGAHLIFSLNATMPVFFLMVLGIILRRIGVVDAAFASRINMFVFCVALPVLLFRDISSVDLAQEWDARFVLDCALITLASIVFACAASVFVKSRATRGEFIQGAYRSSVAILGVALMQNIYGSSQAAAMMIIGVVPLYNAAAVAILAVCADDSRAKRKGARAMLLGVTRDIVTNPIIVGIAAGLLWAALRLPMPEAAGKAVDAIAGLATPLGLVAMGAMADFRRMREEAGASLGASVIKLFGLCAVFLPVCVALGYRGEELMALLFMLGSATTVSSFVMARNMGYEGAVSSAIVMITTLGSVFSLTVWIYLLRCLGLA